MVRDRPLTHWGQLQQILGNYAWGPQSSLSPVCAEEQLWTHWDGVSCHGGGWPAVEGIILTPKQSVCQIHFQLSWGTATPWTFQQSYKLSIHFPWSLNEFKVALGIYNNNNKKTNNKTTFYYTTHCMCFGFPKEKFFPIIRIDTHKNSNDIEKNNT